MYNAKEKVQMRKFVSWVYSSFTKQQRGPGLQVVDSLMNKSDFGAFAKAFTNNALHDSDISEFMSYYAKQRAIATAKRMRVTPTNDTSNDEMF